MTSSNHFTSIDLFAGIGGFRIAVENLGGSCIAYSEIDPLAISTYEENFPGSRESNLGDIRSITSLPQSDLLCAGVPCQSWSIAGKNLGFGDDRGQLWNDTIYLLSESQPRAFIFENVKGLADPRNKEALHYIMERISATGYDAHYYVLNSRNYGVAQSRVRIYIIGFRKDLPHSQFALPPMCPPIPLASILELSAADLPSENKRPLPNSTQTTAIAATHLGFADYFLFNDLRDGDTTIHSWDILDTTSRQKEICLMILKNRRKARYGDQDGNPLSLAHLQQIDSTITQEELSALISLKILKKVNYRYELVHSGAEEATFNLSPDEKIFLRHVEEPIFYHHLKRKPPTGLTKARLEKTFLSLEEKKIIRVCESRYDFRNTRISTGLNGINRIFLPSSLSFPTLVASDSNDYIATTDISGSSLEEYRHQFLTEVYHTRRFRKLTQTESARLQGFPDSFKLPSQRHKWTKLLGNSVAVPVIEQLITEIIATGIFQK